MANPNQSKSVQPLGNADPVQPDPARPEGDAAIADFEFQVCSRCGHPPSDGPCIMGNEEHAETWPKRYAAWSVVQAQGQALVAAERERDELDEARAGYYEEARELRRERDEALAKLREYEEPEKKRPGGA